MDKRAVVAIAAFIGLVFVMYSYQAADDTDPLFCMTDSDCVPAQDCHATSCIGANFKEVSDMFCTLECQPETMDCGQGSCLCHDNKCVVMWVE